MTVGVIDSGQREPVPSSVRLSSVVIRVLDSSSVATTTLTSMVVVAVDW